MLLNRLPPILHSTPSTHIPTVDFDQQKVIKDRQNFPTQLLADAGDGRLTKRGLHALTKSLVGFALVLERVV
jgi:hypothetical protein